MTVRYQEDLKKFNLLGVHLPNVNVKKEWKSERRDGDGREWQNQCWRNLDDKSTQIGDVLVKSTSV